jgi:hypothetical protein
MSGLTDIISNIQIRLKRLPGMGDVPFYPQEDAAKFPYVAIYPGASQWFFNTPGDKKVLYDIVIDLHVARKNLPDDLKSAYRFVESVPNALMSTDDGDLLSTTACKGIAFSGLMEWEVGGLATIGFRWTMQEVKLLTAIT